MVRKLSLGAGSGNRTHVASLEGQGSTIELHLQFLFNTLNIIPSFINLSRVFLLFLDIFKKSYILLLQYTIFKKDCSLLNKKHLNSDILSGFEMFFLNFNSILVCSIFFTKSLRPPPPESVRQQNPRASNSFQKTRPFFRRLHRPGQLPPNQACGCPGSPGRFF